MCSISVSQLFVRDYFIIVVVDDFTNAMGMFCYYYIIIDE